ncbi:MAG: hypothetical protein JWR10_642 [Rubritepida sp.]|nr:hypothetical protein [Rubritepida sp.]
MSAVVVILACLGTLSGAAVFAMAEPMPGADRACGAGELQVERFFSTEAEGRDGGKRVSYFVELNNPQPRSQAYGLRFGFAEAQDRQDGALATMPGRQSLAIPLGYENVAAGAAPLSGKDLAQSVRLNCRSW